MNVWWLHYMNLLSNVFGHFFPPNTCSRLTCTRIPSEPCSFDTYILQLHAYLIDYIVHVWRQQQIFVWILSYLYTIFHSRIRIKVKIWDRILFQETCVVFSLNPNKNSWKWSQVRNMLNNKWIGRKITFKNIFRQI